MPGKAHKSPSRNPFETLNEWGGDVLGQTAKDLSTDFLDQLLQTAETPAYQTPKSGDLEEGTAIHFGKSKATVKNQPNHEQQVSHTLVPLKEKPQHKETDPGIHYHEQFKAIRSETSIRETAEMKRAVEEIKMELERLISSSQILQSDFGQVSFAQSPTSTGRYHVNFFQWVLTVVRQARMKVEDAGAWQTALKGKGNKKSYWGRAEKEGTSFSLHHDRNVATQSG